MKTAYFPLDHFGIAGDTILRDMWDQSTNKRNRKVAFNNMVRLMKASKSIARDSTVDGISLLTMPGGSISIMVEYTSATEENISQFLERGVTKENPDATT